MGVLDDAIRDHLDLKRRHGADPEEVERAEREALGPVRRGAEPDETGADSDEPFASDQEEADWEEPFAEEPGAFSPASAAEAEGVFDQASDLEDAPTTIRPPADRARPEEADDPFDEDEPFADEPATERKHTAEDEPSAEHEPFAEEHPSATEAPHAPPDAPAPEHRDDETAEYSVEDALAGREGKDDDVLEETPDFLQDAPDHDRLWFEQRPPKDFDLGN